MIVWEEIGKGGFIHDKQYVVVVKENEYSHEEIEIVYWNEDHGIFYSNFVHFGDDVLVEFELSELSHFSEINLPVKGDYLK